MTRIMIVDDEEPIRDALSSVIEAAGHQTCSVADGSRCLALLDTFKPDVVITDLLMPGMEGMQTIHELRKQRPDLPIIAMSGSLWDPGLGYLRSARLLGASRTLSKPIEPRALIQAIASLVAPETPPDRQ